MLINNEKMKKLLGIVVLGLLLTLSAKADDIRDFEIEGMSIGDSLLDFMTINEINSSKLNYVPDNKKYYVVGYYKNLNTYDGVDIYLKRNDTKYIIRTIGGMITMNQSNCLKKRQLIVKELRELFSNTVEKNYEGVSHSFDKTGETKTYQTGFLLKNNNDDDHVRVECTNWSKSFEKNNGYTDNLSVGAFTKEILLWFRSGYN